MSTEPPAPQNVRIVKPDGREIPVHLAFDHTDPDGVHLFAILNPASDIQPGDTLSVGMLPAKTGIAGILRPGWGVQ